VQLSVEPDAVSVSLDSIADTTYGQGVQVTGNIGVSPAIAAADFTGGTLTIDDENGTQVAQIHVTGVGTIPPTSLPLTAGDHTLSATFAPNDATDFAADPIPSQTFHVGQAATSVALSAASGQVNFGQDATFTATVSSAVPGIAGAGGTVSLYDNGQPIPLDQEPYRGGPVTLTAPAKDLTPGDNAITAEYVGAGNFATSAPSSPSIDLKVVVPTTIAIASSAESATIPAGALKPGTSIYGDTVSFSAMVNVPTPGVGQPLDGQVVFDVNGSPMSPVPITAVPNDPSSAVATYSTTQLPMGISTITATYSPGSGSWFQPSSSTAFTQTTGLYVVNTDDNTGSDTTPGTLRYAVTRADGLPAPNTIGFAIPGAGTHTIRLNSDNSTLVIDSNVTLDGYSETGAAAPTAANMTLADIGGLTPPIVIDGSNLPASGTTRPPVIQIAGSKDTVEGLVIDDGNGPGIQIGLDTTGQASGQSAATANTIVGNFIGTDQSGLTPVGSDQITGIEIEGSGPGASNNTVSGNVIAGYAMNGYVADQARLKQGPVGIGIEDGASGNLVTDNFIGVGKNGQSFSAENSAAVGVLLWNSPSNTISGNVISGRDAAHVLISGMPSTGNLLEGNFLGTDEYGNILAAASDPSQDGIDLNGAASNTIETNIIAGYGRYGVYLQGTSSGEPLSYTQILNNIIAPSVQVGDPDSGQGLIMSNASNNTVEQNTIGGTTSDAILTGAGTIENTFHHNQFAGGTGQAVVYGLGAASGQVRFNGDNTVSSSTPATVAAATITVPSGPMTAASRSRRHKDQHAHRLHPLSPVRAAGHAHTERPQADAEPHRRHRAR
jgi:parallel beta-helix repeat protein